MDGGGKETQSSSDKMSKKMRDMEQEMLQLKGRMNRLVNEYNTFQAKIKQRVSALEEEPN